MRGTLTFFVLLALCGVSSPNPAQTLTPPPIHYTIGGTTLGVSHIVVSKDGQTFATSSDDGTAKIWRMSDGTLLRTFSTSGVPARGLDLSPDGTTVATGDTNGNLWMWRLSDGSLIREVNVCAPFSPFTNYTCSVWALAYSPDGSVLAASCLDSSIGSGYGIRLFNTADGSLKRTIPGPPSLIAGNPSFITGLAWAPNASGILAASCYDDAVRFWNTNTGALTQTFSFSGNFTFLNVVYSADGTLVAAGCEDPNGYGQAYVWKVADGSVVTNINWGSAERNLLAVAFSPDGTQLAVNGWALNQSWSPTTWALSCATYNVATGALVTQCPLIPLRGWPMSLAYSQDGAMLITGELDYLGNSQSFTPDTQQLLQWNATTGAPIRTVSQITAPMTDASFSADGLRMAIPTGLYGVKVRSTATGAILSSVPSGIAPVGLSRDGALLACATPAGIALANALNGQILHTLPVSNQTLVWFSADHQLTYTLDGTFRAWRTRDGALRNSVSLPIGRTAAVSGDGTILAAINNQGNIIVWSVPPGLSPLQTIPLTSGITSNLTLSANGAYLAFGMGMDACLYRVADGALMADLSGSSTVTSVALSPYGDSVSVGRTEGSVTITSNTGDLIDYWNDQLGAGVGPMRYSPDNTSILIGRLDGAALLCYNPAVVSLASLTLSATAAFGGHDATQGTVTLTAPAPAPTSIALSSSNPAVATVPPTLVIGQNATTGLFPVTTTAVTTPTPVTISATYNGITSSVNLTVTPYVAPRSITLTPSTVLGGLYSVGVVALLKQKAPAGGITFTLSSSNPAAVAPSTVTVPAGKTTAHFLIQTGSVVATTPATIIAAEGTSTVSNVLNIVPAAIASLSLVPNSVQGGVESAVGIVTLAAPVTADTMVTISVTTAGTAGDVSYPATVTIPAGMSLSFFDIATNAPKGASDTVTFKAQVGATGAAGTTSKTASLTVTQ